MRKEEPPIESARSFRSSGRITSRSKKEGRRSEEVEEEVEAKTQSSSDTRLITGCCPTPESVRRSGPKRLKTISAALEFLTTLDIYALCHI